MLMAKAYGACSYSSDTTGVSNWNFNLGTATMSGYSSGAVFYNQTKALDSLGQHTSATCGPAGTRYNNPVIMSGSIDPYAGDSHIYSVGLDGIGIRVHFTFDSANYPTILAPGTLSVTSAGTYMGTGRGNIQVELIKTKDLPEQGAFSYSVPGFFSLSANGSSILFGNLLVTGTILSPSCEITSPTSMNIILGDYTTAEFTSVGHTTTSVPMNIALNCNANTKVNAIINADAETSQSGTVKITAGTGAASGVGIQLVDNNDVPLQLNQKFLVASLPSSGAYTINWKAHYIQTSSAVTTGNANAPVTITLMYE
ncbi:fimbrial protein [Citrobacter amalonaticus]|uniref:fimbrial protein n=1 Tax=Citrobacter amalonaticus TaxID=35703 RepID=UPI00300C1490